MSNFIPLLFQVLQLRVFLVFWTVIFVVSCFMLGAKLFKR